MKDLTRAFTARLIKPPSCKGYWEAKLGALPFHEIGCRYTVGVLTPKDFGSHYKCILHRCFKTRAIDPTAADPTCRVCGLERESIAHWGKCIGLRPIFEALRAIDGGDSWDQAPLNLLGVTSQGGVIPPGISVIHMCVWKELIIELMNATFNPTAVLRRGVARVNDRLDAYTRGKHNERLTLLAKGKEPTPISIHKKLDGITYIDPDGDVMMRPEIIGWLSSHTQTDERVSKHARRSPYERVSKHDRGASPVLG